MSDPAHPTNPEWVLEDPLIKPAPLGVNLILVNEGGSLITGHWYEGAIAWGYKPKVPETVKARLTQKLQKQRELNDATEYQRESRQVDLANSASRRRTLGVPM